MLGRVSVNGVPFRVYPSPLYRTFKLVLQAYLCSARAITVSVDVTYDVPRGTLMFTLLELLSINYAVHTDRVYLKRTVGIRHQSRPR